MRVKFCSDDTCYGKDWFKTAEVVGPYATSSVDGHNDDFTYIITYKYDPSVEPRV